MEQDDGQGSPYADLHIYVVQGVLTHEEHSLLGDQFLGNWVEEDTSYLFFSSPCQETVMQTIEQRPELELVDQYQFTYEQWQSESPGMIQVGSFLIYPPWVSAEPETRGIHIVQDPGVVFGNGLHPTTRDCLTALALARDHQPFKRVLDLGTGTGILAVAAGLLGAEEVLAVDVNPLCVQTAARNVKRNRLEKTVRVEQGRAEEFVFEPGELLIANIQYSVVEQLVQTGTISLFQRMILSGLMRSQARDLKSALERNGARIIREWDHDMTWYTIYAENVIDSSRRTK